MTVPLIKRSDADVVVVCGMKIAAPFRCRSPALWSIELPRLTPYSGAITPNNSCPSDWPRELVPCSGQNYSLHFPPPCLFGRRECKDVCALVPSHPFERQTNSCELQAADDEDTEGFEDHDCNLKWIFVSKRNVWMWKKCCDW